jgi:site-specific DNA-methyltransferase (adenine-specific)
MGEIPDAAIDLIFTSPPYEKLKHYSDNPEDLGNYQGTEFVDRLKPVLAECFRVLKPAGSLFLNFQSPHLDGFMSPTEYLIPRLAIEDVGFLHAQTHYWFKPNVMPMPAARIVKSAVELVWHFTKSAEFYVDKAAFRGAPEQADLGDQSDNAVPIVKDSGNAFFERTAQERQGVHPAKMPLPVAERFILYGSRPGMVVLDPFCGSGTTLAAARKHDRGFVGYELQPEFAEIAKGNFEEVHTVPDVHLSLQNKKWLTMDDMVLYSSVAKATLYSMVCKGELPVHKAGRLNRFDRDEIDLWMRGDWKAKA